MIGIRAGLFAGIRAVLTGAASGPIGIAIIGDSQSAGRGNTGDLTPRVDPAYSYAATQSGTYVRLYRQISQTVSDPWAPDITATDVADGPYTGTGSVVFAGPGIGIAQELTRLQIPAVIVEFAAVGLSCAKMVPNPSPAYPTTGPSWFNLMVAYLQSVAAAKGITRWIFLISSGNNDGLSSTDSNNLCLPGAFNMKLLHDGIESAFPGSAKC